MFYKKNFAYMLLIADFSLVLDMGQAVKNTYFTHYIMNLSILVLQINSYILM